MQRMRKARYKDNKRGWIQLSQVHCMRCKTAHKEQDMILVKLHESENRRILCLCDKNLIGKKFTEREKILDVSKSFYYGKEIGKDIDDLTRRSDIINAVGTESIQLLLDKKLIDKDGIRKIKGIPYAQILQNL